MHFTTFFFPVVWLGLHKGFCTNEATIIPWEKDFWDGGRWAYEPGLVILCLSCQTLLMCCMLLPGALASGKGGLQEKNGKNKRMRQVWQRKTETRKWGVRILQRLSDCTFMYIVVYSPWRKFSSMVAVEEKNGWDNLGMGEKGEKQKKSETQN